VEQVVQQNLLVGQQVMTIAHTHHAAQHIIKSAIGTHVLAAPSTHAVAMLKAFLVVGSAGKSLGDAKAILTDPQWGSGNSQPRLVFH